jgi:hypothetical protein
MRSTTPADQPFLDAIQSTYVDLDRWKARAATTEPPQAGSELAKDDEVFPRHRISEVARMPLILAGKHLRLARDAIEAGNLYPSAHFTLLRGGLVGAAQAVWVLSPDERAKRQERGLTVLTEMHTQMRKYYGRLERFILSEDERRELGEQQLWLTERIEQVATVRTGRKALNLTDEVIPEALDSVFPDVSRRQDGRALWALMSGDAHVLGWSTATRGQTGPTDPVTGLAEGTVGGSFSDIAQPFTAAHGLLRAGWSLFDRRSEGP